MRSTIKTIAAVAMTLFALNAVSATAADTGFHFKAGYDAGGKTLVTVIFDDGSQQNIKSGAGLFFGGGMSIVSEDKTFETEIALTFKVDNITASNGDVTWSRWPVDALGFYRFEKVRLGGGVTYHMSPRLDSSGVPGGLDVKFKDSLGLILQADYRVTERINLGLRYTTIDYEVKGGSGASISANSVGVVFSGSF